MDDDMSAADHAFEAFLAGLGPDSFTGDEATRFRFYRRNPSAVYRAEVEAEITAYINGKKSAA